MSAADSRPVGRYVVPALAQGLGLLSLFSRETPVLTAPEIAQRMALSRTTVFRLLHTLQLMGFVKRGEDERSFTLGPAILNRGFAYLASLDIVEIAQPILQKLRDETHMSAHLAVRDGREIVYVARLPARTTIASTVQIGTRFPVHATVMGRMMLCEFSQQALAELFPSDPLPAFSDQTPVMRADLRAMLAEDRARGFVVSQSFFERGVSSIAAPVRDSAGVIVAAINVTSVDSYVPLEEMQGGLKDAVLRASAELTRWLSSAPGAAERRMGGARAGRASEPV